MTNIGDIWRIDGGEYFVYAIDDKLVHYLFGKKYHILIGRCKHKEFLENAEFVQNVYHTQACEQAKNANPEKIDLLKRIAKEILR